MVRENQFKAQNQDEYQKKYNELINRFNDMMTKLENVILERGRKLVQSLKMEAFIENLKKSPESLDSWSEELWNLMFEKGVVNRDKNITFIFKNGKEIQM